MRRLSLLGITLGLLMALALTGCGGGSGNSNDVNGQPGASGPFVYVSGYVANNTGIFKACYWKNNGDHQVMLVDDWNTITPSVAQAIYGTSGHIYIAGNISSGVPNNSVCYWLDNQRTPTYLDGPVNASVSALFVTGGRVYMAGSYMVRTNLWHACYWVGATLVDLGTDEQGSVANAIAVVNDNIYVAGYYKDNTSGTPTERACYWLNGDPNPIPLGPAGQISMVYGISISNGNIYFGGECAGGNGNCQCCYWVNDSAHCTVIGRPDTISYASSILVSGSDIYLAGTNGDQACYWKNGDLRLLDTVTHNSDALGLVVYGPDVYICGDCSDGSNIRACYWKNDSSHLTVLGPAGTSSVGYSICVQ